MLEYLPMINHCLLCASLLHSTQIFVVSKIEKKWEPGAGKMVQQAKILATNPNDLSSTPRDRTESTRKPWYMSMCMHIINKCEKYYNLKILNRYFLSSKC